MQTHHSGASGRPRPRRRRGRATAIPLPDGYGVQSPFRGGRRRAGIRTTAPSTTPVPATGREETRDRRPSTPPRGPPNSGPPSIPSHRKQFAVITVPASSDSTPNSNETATFAANGSAKYTSPNPARIRSVPKVAIYTKQNEYHTGSPNANNRQLLTAAFGTPPCDSSSIRASASIFPLHSPVRRVPA